MSYDIIFDTQFVKTTDGKIIPMILIGCNNSTEKSLKSGKEIVSRHWRTLTQISDEHPCAWEPKLLLGDFESQMPTKNEEWFIKKGGKWLDDKRMLSWLKKSIDNARPLEEICGVLELGHSCWLSNQTQRDEPYRSVNVLERVKYCTNSEELAQALPLMSAARDKIKAKALAEWGKKYPGTMPDEIQIFNHLAFPNWQQWTPRREHKERITKPSDFGEDYFCVVLKDLRQGGLNFNFVSSLGSRNLCHVGLAPFAKKFATEESAEEWVKKNRVIDRFSKFSFYVAKIEQGHRVSERLLAKLTMGFSSDERQVIEEQMKGIREDAQKQYAQIRAISEAAKQHPTFVQLENLTKVALDSIMSESVRWNFVGENKKKERLFELPTGQRALCIHDLSYGSDDGDASPNRIRTALDGLKREVEEWTKAFYDASGHRKIPIRGTVYGFEDEEKRRSGTRTSLSRFQTEAEKWDKAWQENSDWAITSEKRGIGRNFKGEIIEECHRTGERGRWTGEPLVCKIEERGAKREGSNFETTLEAWKRASPAAKILISAKIDEFYIVEHLRDAMMLFNDMKQQRQEKQRPVNDEGVKL